MNITKNILHNLTINNTLNPFTAMILQIKSVQYKN